MAIAIGRDLNRGVPEAVRHHLERKFEAAVDATVDAPRGVEKAQAVEAVLCLPGFSDDAGSDHAWAHALPGDVAVIFNASFSIGEDQVEVTLRASELPCAQDVDQHGCQRDGAFAGI